MRFLLLAVLCLTAAAAPRRVVLLEELVRVEAMEQRSLVMFPLAQQGAELEVVFQSKRGGEGVQIKVYEGRSNEPLAESKYELNGVLRVPLAREHEYRVELENRRQRLGFGLVDMEVALVFGAKSESSGPREEARTLDPKRRYFTVAASLTLFAMIVAYTAVRLTPPILDRIRGER